MKARALIFSMLFLFGGLAVKAQDLKINADKASIKFYFVAEKTQGTVSGLEAKISFDAEKPGSAKISGTVDVNTLSTGNAKRDEHMKSADFFDVKKYPTMGFISTSVKKTEGGYTMKGDLTIKDVTKSVIIKFSYNNGVFEGKTMINAKEFGVSPKKSDDDSKVKIKIVIPAK